MLSQAAGSCLSIVGLAGSASAIAACRSDTVAHMSRTARVAIAISFSCRIAVLKRHLNSHVTGKSISLVLFLTALPSTAAVWVFFKVC